MYRIVASDMDQTCLGFEHEIPEANIAAIRRMRELGVTFVPASGRAYGSIMGSLAPIADLLQGGYVISYNGNCITRVGDDAPLTFTEFPLELARRVFAWGLEHADVGFHFYTLAGDCWGNRLSDDEIAYLAGHMDITPFDGDSLDFLEGVPLAKMLMVNPDLAYLHEVQAAMPPELYAGSTTTFSSGRYLEFNPVGVSKAAGVRALAEHLGVPMDEVICCGDAANDADMLEAAGLGVVVSNATPDVVAIADYQAQASCSDGILAEVLERFLEPRA